MKILKVLTPNRIIGNLGERRAVWFLRKKGYKILETNYVVPNAEIDIIATKGDITAFIEVKTRNVKHLGHEISRPGASVTPEKQRKIIKAAGYYISRNHPKTRLRLDVIEVYTEDTKSGIRVKEIKHIEGAFDKNTAFDAKYAYIQKKEGSNL